MSSARLKRLFKKIFNGQIFVVLFPASHSGTPKEISAVWRKLAAQKKPLIMRIEFGGWATPEPHIDPRRDLQKIRRKDQDIAAVRLQFARDKEFVWSGDPYVTFSPERGKAFSIPNFKKYRNYNEILLALFGLDVPLFSLHYQPKPGPEIANRVICDFTAGPSSAYNAFRTKKFWDAVIKYLKSNFKKEELLLIDPLSEYPDKRLMNYIKEQMDIETISVGPIGGNLPICSAPQRGECCSTAAQKVWPPRTGSRRQGAT